MVEDKNFNEIKNSIRIYKEESDEKRISILSLLDELSKIPKDTENTVKLIIIYSSLLEKIEDYVKMRQKVINAQDRYIKELEKIVNRMR